LLLPRAIVALNPPVAVAIVVAGASLLVAIPRVAVAVLLVAIPVLVVAVAVLMVAIPLRSSDTAWIVVPCVISVVVVAVVLTAPLPLVVVTVVTTSARLEALAIVIPTGDNTIDNSCFGSFLLNICFSCAEINRRSLNCCYHGLLSLKFDKAKAKLIRLAFDLYTTRFNSTKLAELLFHHFNSCIKR